MAKLCDPAIREHLKHRGDDPENLVTEYARRERHPQGQAVGPNRGTSPMPRQPERSLASQRRLRLCRRHAVQRSEGGLHFLVRTPRAGSFAPLATLPNGKIAVLGLISTKTPHLEDRGELLRKWTRRIALSPWTEYVSARNAASPAGCMAIRLRSMTRCESWSSWCRWRTRCGAKRSSPPRRNRCAAHVSQRVKSDRTCRRQDINGNYETIGGQHVALDLNTLVRLHHACACNLRAGARRRGLPGPAHQANCRTSWERCLESLSLSKIRPGQRAR